MERVIPPAFKSRSSLDHRHQARSAGLFGMVQQQASVIACADCLFSSLDYVCRVPAADPADEKSSQWRRRARVPWGTRRASVFQAIA